MEKMIIQLAILWVSPVPLEAMTLVVPAWVVSSDLVVVSNLVVANSLKWYKNINKVATYSHKQVY